MIDLNEINETIDKLKREGTTIQAAERLAMLYIARDHMLREDAPADMAQGYARAASPTPIKGTPIQLSDRATSEFIAACEGVMIEDVLDVMDRHMEAIAVLYPKEYEAILRQLDERRI